MSLSPTISHGGTASAARPEAERPATGAAVWFDRLIVGWLFGFAIFLPHSIAATQICWSFALLCWVLRYFVRPRPVIYRTPVDYALLGFFILTGISAFASYDPDVSIGKLRAASLFTIVYLFAENLHSRRLVRLLAFTLIASCSINVVYTLGERLWGRGVRVEELATTGPLYLAGIRDGDTILDAGGRAVRTPDQLLAALEPARGSTSLDAPVTIYRYEWVNTFSVSRGQLMPGATPEARLGIGRWTHGRDWRAHGFYGHYVSYAESLQWTASLALGLLVVAWRSRNRRAARLLLAAVAGLAGALLLTVTRASWLAFFLSAAVIVLIGAGRRAAVLMGLCAVPLVVSALLILREKRNVSFFDRSDGSITWRETVYREGFHLLVSRPRHLLVGVGMDSLKRHWREWGLFEGGKLPIGHMHSTPLQLALERGIPTLVAWIIFIVVCLRMLWRLARSAVIDDWVERGIVLGALGGLVGFISSGMVHYNLGDSIVAMHFYFILGLCLVIERLDKPRPV